MQDAWPGKSGDNWDFSPGHLGLPFQWLLPAPPAPRAGWRFESFEESDLIRIVPIR